MPAVISRHHRPFNLIRIFLRLWAIVTIPLAAIWWLDGISPVNAVINGLARDAYISLYRGTFHLLYEELEGKPVEQWPGYVDGMRQHFGYRLSLKSIDDDSLSPTQKDTLLNDEFLFHNGEPPFLAHRIASSRFMLQMFLGETMDEKGERTGRGTIHLLKKKLNRYPPEQWSSVLATYKPYFGFSIELLAIDSDRLSLDADQIDRLRQDKTYTYRHEELGEVAYVLLDDDRQVVRAETGSGGVTDLLLLLAAFSMLCGALAVGIYIWLRPLWRDLKHMDQVAAEFGDGYFDARTSLKKSSVVAGLGHSFNRMAESIQQLIDGQKELINAVSHDLRTPMSRLRFALEMLETESNAEDRNRYIHNIQHSVASLEDLINELLVHARFERSPARLNFNHYDVYAFLKGEVALFTNDSRGIDIGLAPPDKVVDYHVMFDRSALSRALGNLLENAQRHANSCIELTLTVGAGRCEIVVDDDGPGVAAVDRERIFKPFTRLDDNAEGARHGLGLSIVKQIAKWHKGRVDVMDSPLGGARFIFQWPTNL